MQLEQHKLNASFTWPERKGPYRVISEAQAASWNEQGFFLLESVIPKQQLEELITEIDPYEARMEKFVESQGGKVGISTAQALTFSIHVVNRSHVARRFTQSKLMANLCLDLLGENARLYWDQAVYKKPGNPEEFPWHQDNGYSFVVPQDYLTCWIPLVNTTVENGCPWVMPGVHKQGTVKHWSTDLGFQCLTNADDAIPVEAKAGDVVVFSSLTPHRTGPNLTNDIRKAYICQYAHAGSHVVSTEGERTLQHDPDRQFLVCEAGEPVN